MSGDVIRYGASFSHEWPMGKKSKPTTEAAMQEQIQETIKKHESESATTLVVEALGRVAARIAGIADDRAHEVRSAAVRACYAEMTAVLSGKGGA